MSTKRIKDFFSFLKLRAFPSQSQWKRFFKNPGLILSGKEKIAFFAFLALFLSSSFGLGLNFYFKNTRIVPAQGGKYVEGLVGQPRFINPIYAQASDVDRGLVELVFSGLMKYNEEGKVVADLAKNYEIKEDGKVYEIELKENLFWSDGTPLTTDDVIFTIETIQDSAYKSPVIINWLGIKVEKISDSRIKFSLRNPYAPFLENLTQKIIPKHIWQDITPENFPLTVHNLKPIGSGPYKLKTLNQKEQGKITSLELTRNQRYYGKNPYLSQISFRFYDNEQELIKGYKRGEISGFSLTSLANLSPETLRGLNKYHLFLPRYFAIFFNPQKAKILSDQNVRQALNYGTNKDEIIEKVLLGYGKAVHSPILPDIYGFSPPLQVYQFDPEKTKDILEKAGFVEKENGLRAKVVTKEPAFQLKSDLQRGSKGKQVEELQKCLTKDPQVYPEGQITGYFGEQTKIAVIKFQEKYRKEILAPFGLEKGNGIVSKVTRDKLNELCFPQSEEVVQLKFSLSTVDQPLLVQVAENLKEQWQKLGVKVEILTFDIAQLEKNVIKPRNYEMLLFGNVLTMIPDPFAFWHSNQVKDPGLNLALYSSKKADLLLQEIRQIIDEAKRKEKLEQFQNVLIQDAPVVFLYNPDYIYFSSKKIKGIKTKIIADPSKRFSRIADWYIKEKRVWK